MQDQNQIIQRQQTERNSVSTQKTQLRRPRYAALSEAKLREVYEGGEVNRYELLADMALADDYYTNTVTPQYAVTAYRLLCETLRGGQAPMEGRAHIYRTFAKDAIAENWTAAIVDWVIPQYRRTSDTDFAPSFGKLNALVKAGGYSVPDVTNYSSYQRRVQHLLDPHVHQAPKRHVGQRTAPPEPQGERLTRAERAAVIARVNAKRDPLKVLTISGEVA